MGFSRWASGWRGLWLFGAGSVTVFACASASPTEAAAPKEATPGPPPACETDEAREYFCDNLLPFSSDAPAPEPYENCPSNVPVNGSVFPAASSVGLFDAERTKWTRQRVPPGHSCCYSWCSKLELAEPSAVDVTVCQRPRAMYEKLCVSEGEAGVSDSAAAPYEACAAAVKPPRGVSFSPPAAAALDVNATAELRSQGTKDCCYGWCSTAPLGTGFGKK